MKIERDTYLGVRVYQNQQAKYTYIFPLNVYLTPGWILSCRSLLPILC